MHLGSHFRGAWLVPLLFVACSGKTADAPDESAAALDDVRSRDGGLRQDGARSSDGGDGNPSRVPCKSSFGSGLVPGGFGRLDGYVASVVSPGGHACSGDAHHVHLQIAAAGQTYDVAVNVDSGFFVEKDMPLPGGAWSEGWHAHGSLDYVANLGLHSSDFAAGSEGQIDQQIEAALASANHVSVFGNTYSSGGVHLIHRHLGHDDGALVLDPLSPNARVFAFHFANQSF